MFIKVPVIIIIRFDENNVLGTIYIQIYIFQRWADRGTRLTRYFLFIIHENGNTRA